MKTQSEKVTTELETCKNQMWAKDKALEVRSRLYHHFGV